MNRPAFFQRLALALLVITVATGCAHNLQGQFVSSMEDYHHAIEVDRQAGIYAMDSAAEATHAKAARAIAKARKVITEAGEGQR